MDEKWKKKELSKIKMMHEWSQELYGFLGLLKIIRTLSSGNNEIVRSKVLNFSYFAMKNASTEKFLFVI